MKKSFLLALAAGLGVSLTAMADTDPWLWLERVEGANALAWAQAQNERSLDEIRAHPQFEPVHQRALEILTSDERIDYPGLIHGQGYNFVLVIATEAVGLAVGQARLINAHVDGQVSNRQTIDRP